VPDIYRGLASWWSDCDELLCAFFVNNLSELQEVVWQALDDGPSELALIEDGVSLLYISFQRGYCNFVAYVILELFNPLRIICF
jgi:hypothetical protein